ncbi:MULTISPECIES: alpha-L-glutamate ligase-like protein [Nitrincola]|uniref:Glutathione synthase/Ribosomal protein S6 modification enzyme (Glutaminyl transferase) n=1 Tax=Nitrincola nitratireducens TaxID=1229521 RepID=W9VRI6_9GAMM|nr:MULTISPECIES: alpha-L-glutamate ligase-like protein [Nitrincola]EXJ13020.1 Glutathione synthase/Ribosomal protein S6 modification enzyme (glutaminyl transferase) [Nitrincola nitratireducens]
MNWVSPFRLAKAGILGMNCRNVDFIGRYNLRRFYPLVDDKLKTKLLAEEYGVATPTLRFVVKTQHEIGHIEDRLMDLNGFAIKPSRGSGGKGILVIIGRKGNQFIKSSGTEVSIEDIRRHLTNTLAGLYSLRGAPDVAIIEDLIEFDDTFKGYSHEGVPDIRIIVFRGYPVMAMLRLATHASDGKANLHQGAVGVGLDIATGQGLKAVQFSNPITLHPDTKMPLGDLKIPDWKNMLLLASRCYEMSNLGYIGTDIVLDKSRGAQLLELNARPGLSIQVANGKGLLPRLRHIEKIRKPHRLADDRVEYAMATFHSQGI